MQYSRAPITEAIIDLRVALPEQFSVEQFSQIHSHIQDRFPTQEALIAGALLLQADPSSFRVDANRQQNGLLFKSEDNLKLFQATLRGFTFSRLAPYKSWEEFQSDAQSLWQIYKDICRPTNVTRAAVRFINQINIPIKDLNDLKDYLTTGPEVAPALSHKALNSFFMQLQVPQEDLNAMLVINEALVPSAAPEEFISVILDLDLFREQTWPSDDKEIWTFLQALRQRKNQVFEASITDRTRRLIE